MCGICGIINYNSEKSVSQDEIISMRDTMIHRGPDDAGYFINKNIGIGHRRLSIIDLSRNGQQPMSSDDEKIWITYNGEFYNYKKFIPELEKKGYKFKSKTDTEVIIKLYQEYGIEKTITNMIGMFAFCIIDLTKKVQYLVRDRFGIKPLYYTRNNERIAFASEIKGFFKLHDYNVNVRTNVLTEHFLYRRILDFSTIFTDTFELKPGHYLKIENEKIIDKTYYKIDLSINNNTITEQEALIEFDKLITESIQLRMISDVPIGVFLSGGIDSTIVALKMAELSKNPIKTISTGYKEKEGNEFYWSDQVAQKINSDHFKFYDNCNNFLSYMPFLSYIYDAPLTWGVSLYKAAKYVKENDCTVMLIGQGSDEIFIGYSRYKNFYRQCKVNKIFKNLFGLNIIKKIKSFVPKNVNSKLNKKVLNRLDFNEIQIAAAYAASIPQVDFENMTIKDKKNTYHDLLNRYERIWIKDHNIDLLTKFLYSEMYNGLQIILQDTDRMTMASSVETRVPFLDHRLVEFVYSLPVQLKVKNGEGKYLLKKYLLEYFNKNFVYRKKMGFPMPIADWIVKGKIKMPTKINYKLNNIFNIPYLQKYEILIKEGVIKQNMDSVTPILKFIALNEWINNLNIEQG